MNLSKSRAWSYLRPEIEPIPEQSMNLSQIMNLTYLRAEIEPIQEQSMKQS